MKLEERLALRDELARLLLPFFDEMIVITHKSCTEAFVDFDTDESETLRVNSDAANACVEVVERFVQKGLSTAILKPEKEK